jgi:transcriptional regulator with XRE-family HTH domain
MSESTASAGLGARLRQLRTEWGVTQRQVSDALGLSGALVSSWENELAVPPEERLNGYAQFFATRRSLSGPTGPTLIDADDLTTEEERVRAELIDELVRLREEAMGGSGGRPRETGALGGRFWYFPDGQDITILCTPLSARQLGFTQDGSEAGTLLPVTQYATNPTHPNRVRNLGNADIDALLELVGHIRAENPTAGVRWTTYDRIASGDQLTGHLVVLGGGDADESVMAFGNLEAVKALVSATEIPVRTAMASEDVEFGSAWAVTENQEGVPAVDGLKQVLYRPRYLRDDTSPERPRVRLRGAPQLTADVALIVRRPSPLNPGARLTVLSGIFSRGTYGAVRAFTDVRFRGRNEQWLMNSDLDAENFWLLAQVPVLAGENTITPDLSRAANRLRTSS